MAKTLIEAPRGETTFMVMPEDVRIIGVDTAHKRGEHPLWQTRAFREINEGSVANMMVNGGKFVPPIQLELAEDEGWDLADGRGRVIDAREANRRRKERGLEPFALRALVKRTEDEATSFERMMVPNVFATALTLMDRIRDAHASLEQGIAEERVALTAGVDVATLRRWEVVANASQEIQAKVESGEWPFSFALKVAMKPPAQQKAELAKANGEKKTRRELERGTGKVQPPTRKELRQQLKRLDERRTAKAEKGETNPIADAVAEALRWAYEGGEVPAVLRDEPTPRAKARAAKTPRAAGLVAEAKQSIEDIIIAHGLTESATKVFDAMEDIETISTRLTKAGFHIDGKDLSKACLAMLKAGRIDRGPGGYRLKRGAS